MRVMNLQKLSNSLFTKTQQRVLGLLYGAPGRSFYTNEIVRIAAVGRGAVTRELAKLAESGVLKVHAEGNQKHYQANSACPVYADLVKIARKLFDVEIPKPSVKPVKAKSTQVKPKAPSASVSKSASRSAAEVIPGLVEEATEQTAEEIKPPAYQLVSEVDGKRPVEKKPKVMPKAVEPLVDDHEEQLGLF